MFRKSQWNDPKSSIGRYYCIIPGRARSYKCWEAIGPAQTLWKDVLEKKVEQCLNNSGQTFPTSVGKSMYMFGKKEESAQPIIIFCCPEKEWREVAMNTILHSGLLKNHPGVLTGARHLPPEAADDWQDLPTDKSVEWSPYEVLYIPSERSCGVRIFIRAKGGSQQRDIHLRKATGGGIIRYGEQYYYLTAAHAFGDETTFQDYVRFQQEMSLDDYNFKFGVEADDDADGEEDSDEDEHLMDITSKGSTTSGSDESSTTSAELSSADTQQLPSPSHPRPDDMQLDLQLENNEDADRSSAQFEDTSQAASGSSKKDISYEVLGDRLSFTAGTHLDFALINIKTPHLCTFNEIRWQSGAETKIIRPERIAQKPKNANIVTVTGSAGVLEGYLSGTPSFWNVPHSSILCQFWTVRLEGILSNGDCGSWVVDAETGDLYGHIVAGSPSNRVAYIVPTCQIQDYLENSVEACTFELSTGSSSPSMELKKLHSEAIRDPEICEYEREDIRFSPAKGGRPRPREVGFEREEIKFREGGPPRPREVGRDEFIYQRDERREESRRGREREFEKDTLVVRGRKRSLPPSRSRGELVAREREEFIVRRQSPPSPPPDRINDEIIIRRMEERSPPPLPLPPPPLESEPAPIVRPPIIQEVITDYRPIDHGKLPAPGLVMRLQEDFVQLSGDIRQKRRSRIRSIEDSTDEARGKAQGSPMSPTHPPSVRKRQSIDLQQQLEQLAAQNRSLEDATAKAEEAVQAAEYQRQVDSQVVTDAVEARDREIRQKDIDIARLKDTVQRLQEEVARPTEFNNTLTEANRNFTNDTNERYAQLQAEGQQVHQQWQQSLRELEELRAQNAQMTSGMEEAVRAEIGPALEERNAEIERLNAEHASAKEQIKTLQKQIPLSKVLNESFLTVRDEDYFDSACQQLCLHVQQWVLRFSKFSDARACRLSSEIAADTKLDGVIRQKINTRLDNAILDGSDVDMRLADRVRRRDVFMSVVMTMIWEFIFTRYLFGMDRGQRQKLKSLEKTLSEVGPTRAVAQWRAITLTLLSKGDAFIQQRAQNTEAVVHEIYSTLSIVLPPPSHLEHQIQESLRNVIRLAVELSIEMRTQRAEYIMLPPLQPEYDTNGNLVAEVTFNASLMNERSGETTSNDELEARGAIVKIVLFPLVVKKGDDFGESEDEIVVCPAQVLVAGPQITKVVRVMSGAMSIDSRQKSVKVSPESYIMDLSGSNVI